MRRPRFRLLSMMFLVLIAALAMAAAAHLSRLNREEFVNQAAFLGGFLAIVTLKMGIFAGARWRIYRRTSAEDSPSVADLPGPSDPDGQAAG